MWWAALLTNSNAQTVITFESTDYLGKQCLQKVTSNDVILWYAWLCNRFTFPVNIIYFPFCDRLWHACSVSVAVKLQTKEGCCRVSVKAWNKQTCVGLFQDIKHPPCLCLQKQKKLTNYVFFFPDVYGCTFVYIFPTVDYNGLPDHVPLKTERWTSFKMAMWRGSSVILCVCG